MLARFRHTLLCAAVLLAGLPLSLSAVPTTSSSAQNDRTVTLHLEKVHLGVALDSIERRTPYIFLVEGVDLQQVVSVNVRNASISTLMDRLLADTNVSWRLAGSNIILAPRQEQDAGPRAPSRITGKVVDVDGVPIPGSAIVVTGTRIGATADVDGSFTLRRIPPTAKTVDVSSIGFKTRTIPIEDGLVVVLEMDTESLNEAVVTGMTSIDKRLFTGATDFISAADAKIDGLVDISRSLEGRSAGVVVQNVSGSFGTAPKIRVRGATSIYGSSKPLWVVDGVIIEDVTEISSDQLSSGDANTLISSAIAGLNADDIESFQILKDGSATSIYGARAMAGVIVVTTKKGSSDRTSISYTGEFTSRLIPSYRNFNIMNSQDQMAVYQELQQKGWINYAKTSSAPTTGVFGKMYELVNTFNPKTGFALENTTAAMEEYLRAAEYRNTDWFEGLFSAAIQRNHSLSISGGSRNAQYYISLSAMDDPGWTLQSAVQRYTANANATYHITDNLYVNIIGNASTRKQRAPGTLDRNVNALAGEVTRAFDINPYSYALNTSRTLDPDEYYRRDYAPFNIFNELENNYMDLRVSDFRINGRIGWKPVKDLELTLLAAAKGTYTGQDHYILESSNMPQGNLYRTVYPTITFFNTLGEKRSAPCTVFIDNTLASPGTAFELVGPDGTSLAVQQEAVRGEGRYFTVWAEDIPAMGYKTFEIRLGQGSAHIPEPSEWDGSAMENDYYRIEFDPAKGGIRSLYDKQLGKELIDKGASWNLGECIYETLQGDREQMNDLRFDKYDRRGFDHVKYTGTTAGDLFTTVSFVGSLMGSDKDYGVRVDVKLYHKVKRIDLCYRLKRLPETDPAGIYVAFPFEVAGGKLAFDVPGGLLVAGENQIPSTTAAWNTVQSFVSARNKEMQVLVSTPEVPLWMMGELMNDPFRKEHLHDKTHCFSWVMNNYWFTNFRAFQEGEFRWDYAITSLPGCSDPAAWRFGHDNRTPLYARVLPAVPASAAKGSKEREKSFLSIDSPNLLLVGTHPSEDGSLTLSVRETGGKKTVLSVRGKDGDWLPFVPVNILGEEKGAHTTSLEVAPYANVFVRLNPD